MSRRTGNNPIPNQFDNLAAGNQDTMDQVVEDLELEAINEEEDINVDDDTVVAEEKRDSGFDEYKLMQQELKAANPSQKSLIWDFREGKLPENIEIVGGEAEFVIQSDGSYALALQPHSYLKVQK